MRPNRLASLLIAVALAAWTLLVASPALSFGAAHIGTERSVSVGRNVRVLEDPSGALDVTSAASAERAGRYRELGQPVPNLSYSKSAWWLEFQLINEQPRAIERLLEVGYPRLDQVDLYVRRSDGAFEHERTGDELPFAQRPIPHRDFVFPLTLPASSTVTCFLRVWTNDSIQVPLTVWTPDAFHARDRGAYLGFGLYFGVALVMILYNFGLLLFVRDGNYLLYIIYVASFALYGFAHNGLAYQYLWPGSPGWASRCIHVFASCTTFSVFLFTRSFLHTRAHTPKLDWILLPLQWWSFLLILLNLISYGTPSIRLTTATAGIGSLLVLLTAARALNRGFRPARYYLLGFTMFFGGVIAQALKQFGVLQSGFITEYGMQLGSGAEMVLLSLSLADRINLLREEKERAQLDAVENLQKANRLKDEFLATTSHELRTPLHAIVATAESLQGRGQRDVSDLELISSCARRLAGLVDDILDFSQLKSKNLDLKLEPVSLRQRVDLILALCRSLTHEKSIALKNEVPADLPPALADDDRLQQVLYNLVGNAIKFTEQGEVRIGASVSHGRLECTVSDSGAGIQASDLENIFQPFEQAGAREQGYGGTGLGLAVTRQLVELHGGSITASSTPGVGSTFTFTLPIADGSVEDSRPSARAEKLKKEQISALVPAPSAAAGFHVLLVDDEPVNLRVLSTQLSANGYSVSIAESGKAMLQRLSEEGKPDLVLLDIMMPVMDGYQACAEIRKRFNANELPIVLLSAKNRVTDKVVGLESGANDYLSKPCTQAELLARLKTHIMQSRVHLAYGHFVPSEFLRCLVKESILDVRLGDYVDRDVTVMFADVRSYTRLVETLPPHGSIALINEILGAVGPEIHRENGFIVRYTGDGLMAVFPDRAINAMRAAAAMRQSLQRLNQARTARGEPEIEMAAGIHSGPVALGTIGDSARMEGTVVSDVVNLASRVEGLTKWFRAPIVFTESTLKRLDDGDPARYRSLGRVRVVGRNQPVEVFELFDPTTRRNPDCHASFEQGVSRYYEGKFHEALHMFEQVQVADPADSVAAAFVDRCKQRAGGAPGEWAGFEPIPTK